MLPDGTDPARVDVWFEDESAPGPKGDAGPGVGAPGKPSPGAEGLSLQILRPVRRDLPGKRHFGHVCNRANTDEMNRHLVDIATAVPRGRHVLVVLDGAGWHRSKSLEIPDNVSPLRLSPYGPDPNPVETVFQFLEQDEFPKQVFATAEEVNDRVEKDWNDVARTPGRIASIGKRSWARPCQHTGASTGPARVAGWAIVFVFRFWSIGMARVPIPTSGVPVMATSAKVPEPGIDLSEGILLPLKR